jgi:hypothetical protein
MNASDATIEAPPDGLALSFMPAMKSQKNPLRGGNNSMPPATPVGGFPYLPQGYPPSGSPYPYYPQYPPPGHQYPPQVAAPPTLMQLPSQLQVTTNSSESLNATNTAILRSSPVSETDPAEILHEYILWMSSKSPIQAPQFMECYLSLKHQFHTIETVAALTDTQFKDLDIDSGIGMQLKMKVDKFKRYRARG